VFLSDDHAPWSIGCYGAPGVSSPSMDWLAQIGMRADHAFTPSPVCSPARASFFTGRMPSCHGIHDFLGEPTETGQAHPGLTDQPQLGTLLHQAGYQTALIGKWHCGTSWAPHAGFDRWYSYGSFQFPHKGPIAMSDQGLQRTFHGYQTTHFTDQALDFLQHRDRARPFFLVVGYVDTHGPHKDHPERLVRNVPEEAIDAIPDEPFSEAHGVRRFNLPEEPEKRRAWRRQHLGAVRMMDEQMGRILDELDGEDELENTLTAYTADHGYMLGHHGCTEKGNCTVPQNFFEEAIRVPLMMAWPGVIPAGHVVSDRITHCDTWATILDAAGVKLDAETRETIRSPGRSFLPMARGEAAPSDWEQAFFGDYGNARCVRAEGLKLIRRGPGPNGHFPDELYDLNEDPRETENRIERPEYGESVARLDARLEEHFAAYEDPARRGWEIEAQPPTGSHEPWRGTPGPQ
jgi:arylsulfatase A-like enzyme